MKVLVYDEWIPWPLDCGKKIRTYCLLRELSKHHEIILLTYAHLNEVEEKQKHIRNICSKYLPVIDKRINKWTIPFYFDILKNFYNKEPYTSIYHISKEYALALQEVILTQHPDIIHCEWTNFAPYLNYVGDLPKIITAHNIEADIWRRLGDNGTSIIKRAIGKNQRGKIEKLERYWYSKVDRCIAVSDIDKKLMTSYGAKVTVVENGVDIAYYNHYDNLNSKGEDNCISFTASFDTFSNQDGVDYFFTAIFPYLLKICSNIKVLLIGKSPPKRFYDYKTKYKNIVITGTVDDVRKYAAKSKVSIVPLRIGGGSRLKILEAMAMNIPVVSTKVGAEGLDVVNGKEIIISDDPKKFADNVVRLLSNQTERNILTQNAFKLVSEKYDWKVLAIKQHQAWLAAKEHYSMGIL